MAVLNKYKLKPGQTGVYIGRGSMWGNPFVIGKHGDRDEVCDLYDHWLYHQVQLGKVTLEQLAGLHGKDLICFCAPARCHGQILELGAAWAVKALANKT